MRILFKLEPPITKGHGDALKFILCFEFEFRNHRTIKGGAMHKI
jgi:hypothetical protein